MPDQFGVGDEAVNLHVSDNFSYASGVVVDHSCGEQIESGGAMVLALE